jgi:hypothetical protein
VVAGYRVFLGDGGVLHLKPPRLERSEDRVYLRSGPDRDAVLAEVVKLITGPLDARPAAPPLATAPQTQEPALVLHPRFA